MKNGDSAPRGTPVRVLAAAIVAAQRGNGNAPGTAEPVQVPFTTHTRRHALCEWGC